MPRFPVHYQLPEFVETHVHQVSDAIQLCHSLASPSPPAKNSQQKQDWELIVAQIMNSLLPNSD